MAQPWNSLHWLLQNYKVSKAYCIVSLKLREKVVKIKKSYFFLLGLKYTLRTCFESKNFLPKSCPELSNQVLSSSASQI